jgi:quercetin dioxygenase-like cupin family protein
MTETTAAGSVLAEGAAAAEDTSIRPFDVDIPDETLDDRPRGGSVMAAQQPPGIERTDLQQHDLSVPGHEVVQARVDIGPEAPFIKHTHPGEEIIYVLEGSLEYEVEGQAPRIFTAGDALTVPAGAVHAVRNVGSGNAAELATYVVEKGKPIITLV